MKKMMIAGIMAYVVLLAGCTTNNNEAKKEENIKPNNTDSSEVVCETNEPEEEKDKDNDENEITGIKVVDGKYEVDKETFNFGIDEDGYSTSGFQRLKPYGEGEFDHCFVVCEEDGIYYCDSGERHRLEEELNVSEMPMSEQESYEIQHLGREKIIDEKNCRNICIYEDKFYFLTEDGNACVYSFETNEYKSIQELSTINIDDMYVINDSNICFNVGKTVYQYQMGDNKITKIKKVDDLFEFIPTRFGIVYIVENENTYEDVYADDVKVLENVERTFIRKQLRIVDRTYYYDGKDEMIYYDKDHKDYEYKLEDAFNATGIVEGRPIE